MIEVQVHIVGDKQIEVPIAVIIHKGAPGAPACVALIEQTRLPRHIRKGAIAVVAVKSVLTVVGDEDVFKTIVVVIRYSNSAGPACAAKARLIGNIGEGSIPIVLVEPICRRRSVTFQSRSRQEEDVQPTIVVIVQEGHTAANGFQYVGLLVNAAVDGWLCQSGLGSDIRKARVEWKP